MCAIKKRDKFYRQRVQHEKEKTVSRFVLIQPKAQECLVIAKWHMCVKGVTSKMN